MAAVAMTAAEQETRRDVLIMLIGLSKEEMVTLENTDNRISGPDLIFCHTDVKDL